ncbi:MAG: hypothetical protein LBB95_01015 [Mycoplasmataceae bacterium]|nr:hypothetical protein [Mycoplasmataceae bacterium]
MAKKHSIKFYKASLLITLITSCLITISLLLLILVNNKNFRSGCSVILLVSFLPYVICSIITMIASRTYKVQTSKTFKNLILISFLLTIVAVAIAIVLAGVLIIIVVMLVVTFGAVLNDPWYHDMMNVVLSLGIAGFCIFLISTGFSFVANIQLWKKFKELK